MATEAHLDKQTKGLSIFEKYLTVWVVFEAGKSIKPVGLMLPDTLKSKKEQPL